MKFKSLKKLNFPYGSEFLKNSNFWSVFIAGMALFFSLTPPVSHWVKTDSLSMLYSNRTLINNYFGIVSYGILIDFRNTGNTDLSITKIELTIQPESGQKKVFLAEATYGFYGSSQTIVTPMTRIVIKPAEQWKEVIFFYPAMNPELELEINELKYEFAEDLNEQQRGFNTQTLKSAPFRLIEKAKAMFDQNFDLKKGNYEVKLVAYSNDKLLTSESYEFKIESFQIAANQAQKNDYRYGIGIYSPTNVSLRQLSSTLNF